MHLTLERQDGSESKMAKKKSKSSGSSRGKQESSSSSSSSKSVANGAEVPQADSSASQQRGRKRKRITRIVSDDSDDDSDSESDSDEYSSRCVIFWICYLRITTLRTFLTPGLATVTKMMIARSRPLNRKKKGNMPTAPKGKGEGEIGLCS